MTPSSQTQELNYFLNRLSILPTASALPLSVAFDLAKVVHHGQKKFGIWNYLVHPVAVANLLSDLYPEWLDLQVAGLLHDVIEDGDVTGEEIRRQFGSDVATIVELVTHAHNPTDDESIRTARNQAHFQLLVQSSNRGAQLLQLVDEYDNLRNWQHIPVRNPLRQKFPRWIQEAQAHIGLAAIIDQRLAAKLRRELNQFLRLNEVPRV